MGAGCPNYWAGVAIPFCFLSFVGMPSGCCVIVIQKPWAFFQSAHREPMVQSPTPTKIVEANAERIQLWFFISLGKNREPRHGTKGKNRIPSQKKWAVGIRRRPALIPFHAFPFRALTLRPHEGSAQKGVSRTERETNKGRRASSRDFFLKKKAPAVSLAGADGREKKMKDKRKNRGSGLGVAVPVARACVHRFFFLLHLALPLASRRKHEKANKKTHDVPLVSRRWPFFHFISLCVFFFYMSASSSLAWAAETRKRHNARNGRSRSHAASWTSSKRITATSASG